MKFLSASLAPPLVALALMGTLDVAATHHDSRLTNETIDSLKLDTATTIGIDLDRAVDLKIPEGKDLKAVAFTTPDGRTGWSVQIPGGRPIATPAYADGMIFVGGGYGSYEFYAFNAETGKLAWKIHTADDGPSAAVVEDGYVAFNTESCTVIVVEAATGKVVWQEWLGDPLMSQPAISKGRLYIAHPNGGRGSVLHNQQQVNHSASPPVPEGDQTDGEIGSHRMLCADLKTGRHIWSHAISSDVISAPIVEGDTLLFTCFDGTSYCMNAVTGEVIWKKQNAGTSAPLIIDGHAVLTMKEERQGESYEGFKRVDLRAGTERDSAMLGSGKATYLGVDNGGGVALQTQQLNSLDQSVGFGTAPATANLKAANDNVGVNTVAGGWAYQGSRAAYKDGQIMNAQGRYLNSVKSVDGKMSWRAEARGREVGDGAQVFSPPALGTANLYLSTAQGHLLSVRQKDGGTDFLYRTNHPVAFQPALAGGNMYVGTSDGWVICLKTGTRDADGWYAWGGNAQHNKK